MLLTADSNTIESPLVPEFDKQASPDWRNPVEDPGPDLEEAVSPDEPWYERGAWGLRADDARKSEENDEDSDYSFDDDFEDDDADEDEDDDFDEGFDDEEGDEDLDDFEDDDL